MDSQSDFAPALCARFFHLLQHGVSVQAQLILDHAVGNLLGHLSLGHLVRGEVLTGKAGAIDGARELICTGRVDLDVFQTGDDGGTPVSLGESWDFGVVLDGSEVYHVGGWEEAGLSRLSSGS